MGTCSHGNMNWEHGLREIFEVSFVSFFVRLYSFDDVLWEGIRRNLNFLNYYLNWFIAFNLWLIIRFLESIRNTTQVCNHEEIIFPEYPECSAQNNYGLDFQLENETEIEVLKPCLYLRIRNVSIFTSVYL